jgi:hypothetical protein
MYQPDSSGSTDIPQTAAKALGAVTSRGKRIAYLGAGFTATGAVTLLVYLSSGKVTTSESLTALALGMGTATALKFLARWARVAVSARDSRQDINEPNWPEEDWPQ